MCKFIEFYKAFCKKKIFGFRKAKDLTKQEMEIIQKIIVKLCAWYLFVARNYKHKGASEINKRCEGQRYLHLF
jgi:NADPH-dependent 7-cyano-7-deazaguanine reductase QueF